MNNTSSVSEVVASSGRPRRTPVQFNARPYACDETFFEVIDTPEKAYWFGFIAADGCIFGNFLTIGLQKRDKCHLEAFKARLKFGGPITMREKEQVAIQVGRKKIVDDLKNLGLTYNKTFKINEHIFDKIPEKYLNAAVHGYSDGDGSICLKKEFKTGVSYSLAGNLRFLKFIRRFFKKYNLRLSKPSHVKKTKQTYATYLWINKERLNQFERCLFTNPSEDFLVRKKEKLECLKNPDLFSTIKRLEIDEADVS